MSWARVASGVRRVWSRTAASAAGEERVCAAKAAASKGAGTAILRLGVVDAVMLLMKLLGDGLNRPLLSIIGRLRLA